ncbi:MAG: HIT family protein [Nitrosomonadaceae bacterium]|nr:HIT family protein [Nitrosomonadaceae bacterium]|tara:strand:- start:165 stop:626 length:462 start_codon:yes stop_codon:yes gene_type:complete
MPDKIKSTPLVFNKTMRKFGAPHTIICQYHHWSILLRPIQLTLGSIILIAHDPASRFSEISPESFTELHTVTKCLECALNRAFAYDKLNYLMLMMVDRDVHFHVIPRYSEPKQFNGIEFTDPSWPGAPDLNCTNKTNLKINADIITHIKSCLV